MTASPAAFGSDAFFQSLAAGCASRLSGRTPLVSIVIPVFNKWDVTASCLASLLVCDPEIDIEVFVVDDASHDETPMRLAQLPGINVIRNGTNLGFVGGCNRGAALARGQYLYFLNNDTELASGAIRALVSRMERTASIGIVGSKLVYPDGRLQEAGGVIWSDASGWNYGRLDAPVRPAYNFFRDVDYVSGASLLVRTELFRTIGGFDSRFAPGYYEDADLCFEVRARGYRVSYEPLSVVTHFEGLTSGTDLGVGMKRFQTINKTKFEEKWSTVLHEQHHLPNAAHVDRAARSRGGEGRAILIVDSYVPLYDKEAGSNRLQQLIVGLRAGGTRVVFFPDNLMPMMPYTAELQSAGIEVVYSVDDDTRTWDELFIQALSSVDLVWICRPELCKKYLPLVRAHARLPVIYDTIDLHHVRRRRQLEHEGRYDDESWRDIEALELSCAFAADGTVVVSDAEASVLREHGVSPIAIVPTVHDDEDERTVGFDDSRGLLFIGGFNHTPNVDAVSWLIEEIMPLVWAEIPGLSVTILGSNPPPAITRLASPSVKVTGFIRDVSPYFRNARLFIGPLRYGAGVKGKIGQALAFGIPIVTTAVGAEGFDIRDGASGLLANDAEGFAAAIVELYYDRDRWERLSAASSEVLAPFRSENVVATARSFIEELIHLTAAR